MTTRVKAKGPDGKESFYVYDPQSVPLGSGHTGVVYAGWEESRPEGKVAIKVSRSASDVDMQRELEILARLYAPGEPGGNAVLWAAGGQEDDVSPAAACMVMELVGGDFQMSRRMGELGKKTLPEADILEKEKVATEAGLQYAQLLVRMKEQGVISRGDRKGTDFRLVPGNGRPERLVVLDWNRGEIIDTTALKNEGRWSAEYIRRREHDLALGRTGDIRIFARWWAEFVLGRDSSGALPKIDDKDLDWVALTRGFREILLRAEAADTARGFEDATELKEALARHAERLEMGQGQLRQAMAELQRDNAPTLSADMLVLIDLAERRRMSDIDLDPHRKAAGRGGQDAMSMARKVLAELKDSQFGGGWEWARGRLSDTRNKMGEITPDTVAAHLMLLRIDAAIDAARSVPNLTLPRWASDLWKLSEAMSRLGADSMASADSRDLLARLSPDATPGTLRPLELELDLRTTRDGSTAIKTYKALHDLRSDYAAALRVSLPNLDRILTDYDRDDKKRSRDAGRGGTLTDAWKRLIDQFIGDVNTGRLPPATHQEARELRDKTYRPLWDAYYDARHSLSAAGPQPPDEGAAWLAALLDSMLRLRADDAAARLVDPPEAAKSALGNAADLRRRCFGRWLTQLENSATSGEPRWPDDIERATNLVKTIGDRGDPLIQQRAEPLAQQLRDAATLQESLRRQLGTATPGGITGGENWAAFRNRILTDDSSDIDEALRQAVDNRLEVWPAPAVAEDPFDPDYPGRVAEGYRARTLLALRAAALLPRRARQYSEELRTLADALDAGQTDVGIITGTSRAADAYATQMVTLNTMKSQLQEFNKIKEDFATEGDVAKNRQELESWRKSLDNLLNQIDAKTRTASQRIEQLAPLAQMWLVFALDQAAQLKLDDAMGSVKAARDFSSADVIGSEANAIETAIAQMQELSKRADAQTGVWGQLWQVRDAMQTGNRKDAAAAWGQVQRLNPDWADNRVLQRLDQRVMAMPELASVPPSTSPLPKPEQLVTTETKPVLGETTTMEQPPPVPLGKRLGDNKNQWAIIPRDTDRKQNSTEMRRLALETEKLLDEKLSPSELNNIQFSIQNAINAFSWDNSALMDHDNNYGHLYALDYKIEKLLEKAQRGLL